MLNRWEKKKGINIGVNYDYSQPRREKIEDRQKCMYREIYIVFKSIIRWRPVKKMEMAQDWKEGWEGNDAMKKIYYTVR